MLQEANRHLQHIQFSEGPQLTAATITELVRGAANASGRLTRQRICSVLSTVRRRANLPEDSTLVLLTETGSDGDWLNIAEGNSHYIWFGAHTPSFESASQVEILYLLANNLLGAGMYDGFEELARQMHTKLRGCILDRCADHEDLSVKMRTADACPECMAQIRSRIAAGKLSAEVVDDCFRLMDAVRTKSLAPQKWELEDAAVQPRNSRIQPGSSPPRQARSLIAHSPGLVSTLPAASGRRSIVRSERAPSPSIHHPLVPEDCHCRDTSLPGGYHPKARGKRGWSTQSALFCHPTHPAGAVGPRDSELYVIRGERGKEFRIPLSKDNIDWTDQRGNPVVIGHRKAM